MSNTIASREQAIANANRQVESYATDLQHVENQLLASRREENRLRNESDRLIQLIESMSYTIASHEQAIANKNHRRSFAERLRGFFLCCSNNETP